ncbi:MAG: response regulator [Candidatus Manganitrophus sp. SA1]|nr:response regulator [Candidatus Manganitrophus morganii]
MYKILVVDDNAETLYIYTRLFSKNGYEIAIARGGEEALEQIIKSRPDLVILDVMIPKFSGWELARIIRNTPEWKSIIILIVSGAIAERDGLKRFALENDVDEVIPKPIIPHALIAKVKAHLKEPPAELKA